MTGISHSVIEWGWAGSALEDESGDLHVVAGFRGGVLVALIDGLGHGPEAADAARAAAGVLESHAGEPVLDLMQRCHEALRRTRGAVMTIASISAAESALTWVGVGNVDGVVLRKSGGRAEAIAARGGVVGYQLPPLRASALSIAPGDLVIMASDGVRSGFTVNAATDDAPQDVAASVLGRFAKGSDDAHVVVARYLGGLP
jgi:serine phosphatase RsbU (regulator of sigma subunit)